MDLGRNEFEGNIANSYVKEATIKANSSSVTAPITHCSSAFDLNEFPSLGVGGGSSSGGESNGLAAAIRQQHQLLSQQQIIHGSSNKTTSTNLYRSAMGSSLVNSSGSTCGSNLNIASEDFPALPGAPPSGNTVSNVSSGSTLRGDVDGVQRDILTGTSVSVSTFRANVPSATTNASNMTMFNGDAEILPNHLDSSSLLNGLVSNLGNMQPSVNPVMTQKQRTTTTDMGATTTPYTGNIGISSINSGTGATSGSVLSGDYGLLGLLGIIRMSDADRNALALGSDLTSLGLSLNSNSQLYSTFASPWSESPTAKEPHYQLPMCYYMQPPALKTGHLTKFQLETLFYIFYALPKDVLQAYAAQELYSREWRYHVDLKLWFKRAGPSDGIMNTGSSFQYIYFDINSWERRLFNGSMNQNITSGLLSDDDIRVKFPNS